MVNSVTCDPSGDIVLLLSKQADLKVHTTSKRGQERETAFCEEVPPSTEQVLLDFGKEPEILLKVSVIKTPLFSIEGWAVFCPISGRREDVR
jgi:hypothetical protein